MTLTFDSAILVAILGVAVRAVWIVAEIKTTLANVVTRVENHEQRITALEQG